MKLFDPICGRTPDQIDEYIELAKADGMTPEEWARAEEGTLDPATGQFVCTSCYMAIGQPAKPFPQRWTATPENLAPWKP